MFFRVVCDYWGKRLLRGYTSTDKSKYGDVLNKDINSGDRKKNGACGSHWF